MKKCFRFFSLLIIMAVLFSFTTCLTAFAHSPYDVYNYDSHGFAVPSQAGYIAEKSVSGNTLGISDFNSPSDIFAADNGTIYIADTGNNRIVALNSELDSVIDVYDTFYYENGSKTVLAKPTGIYISSEKNLIYIADSENSRILVSDFKCNVIKEITKPDSAIYPQSSFHPLKVISDNAGNIYAVLGNITSGAAMFDADGKFIGFYGANRVDSQPNSIDNFVKKLFTTAKKKARQERNIPSAITNFDIDEKGFIFTCTQSATQSCDIIKKLNSAGKNIFADKDVIFGDITPVYDSTENIYYHTMINDIDVSSDGCINCLDLTTGRIFRYDEECNLLFIMGTKAEQVGGFSNQVTAIESYEDMLYVTDGLKNTVTFFRETPFGKTVHKAISLYNDGFYEEALEPWYEVLRCDGNYRIAYLGVSVALLKKNDYKGAMEYAKLAESSYYYNKAFEGWRNEFLKENFTIIIAVIVITISIISFIIKRKKHKERS